MAGDDLDLGWLFWRLREALLVVEVASGRIVAANTPARAVFGYGPTDELTVPLDPGG